MSQEDIVLELELRNIVRKGLTGLRSTGKIPAVIHNRGSASVNVMGESLALQRVYKRAGKHHAVNLRVGDQDYLAMIKKADFEPKKNTLEHIVFQAIDKNQKVETEVPIVIEGEVPAEKAGLLVITNVDTVDVEALPGDLPDNLKVDGTKLEEIGDKLHVSDLIVPKGVVVMTDAETTIAVVEETKAQMSEESAEEETAEGEEGESSEETTDAPASD